MSRRWGLKSQGNRIVFHSLNHPKDVSSFYYAMYNIVDRQGYQDVVLDFSRAEPVYPNACVPVVAAIDYYKSLGVDVVCDGATRFVENSCIISPITANKDVLSKTADPVSKLWRFEGIDGVHTLTSMYVDSLSERIVCSRGVMEGFEWCLNEVMDNVLQHSVVQCGYVMVQVHIGNESVAACVSDAGIGIYNSLKDSTYKPRTHTDAITLAIREGVTRDTKVGQGNGLWGLTQIVSENKGRIRITSGSGSIFHDGGAVETFKGLPYLSVDNYGTTVDFQMITSSEIDMSKSLQYNHVNLRVEAYEARDGVYDFKVKNESHGTGTRRAAIMVRNRIENLLKEVTGKIRLDFEGVGVISSSYADELVGKLIVKYGFYNFQKLFELENMNDFVQGILQRSIAQRLGESVTGKN
jgi:hypothetical protein